MFLGQNLIVQDRHYPMVGAIAVDFALEKGPQGHGYTILECMTTSPYFSQGERIKGHEFHYSRPIFLQENPPYTFRVLRGNGMDGSHDGICIKNLMATYTHIHAGGDPSWAGRLVRVAKAIDFRRKISQGMKKRN